MRTTLNINDELLRELRERAASTGRPFRAVLEETISLGLSGTRARRRPFKVRPHPLKLKIGFRNISLNQVYDQIEAEAALSNR